MQASEVLRIQGGIEDSGSVGSVNSRTVRGMYMVECKNLWSRVELKSHLSKDEMHAYGSAFVSSDTCRSTNCTSDSRSHTTCPYQSTQDPHTVPVLSLCLSS